MFASSASRASRRLFFAAALFAALVFGFPGTAFAATATAGPFDVSGPESSYSWDGSTLFIALDGVAINGMVDPSGSSVGNVSVAAGVSNVTLGENVRIDALSVADSTSFTLTSTGNEVGAWRTVRGDAVNGSGSVTVGTLEGSLDLHQDATLALRGSAAGIAVWEQARLVLEQTSSIAGPLTTFGGTLDLSRVRCGQPLGVGGVSVGASRYPTAIVAPFGATHLGELLSYPPNGLFVNVADVAVREDGERVGVLRKDGSFAITAVRTVEFLGFDGAPLATETVPLFSAAAAPEVEAPDGYRFAGWDRAFDFVTEDMVVAARFEAVPEPSPEPNNDGATSGSGSSIELERPVLHQRVAAQGKLVKTGDALPPALPAAFAFAALAASTTASIAFAARRK